jgi:hypothetical protein
VISPVPSRIRHQRTRPSSRRRNRTTTKTGGWSRTERSFALSTAAVHRRLVGGDRAHDRINPTTTPGFVVTASGKLPRRRLFVGTGHSFMGGERVGQMHPTCNTARNPGVVDVVVGRCGRGGTPIAVEPRWDRPHQSRGTRPRTDQLRRHIVPRVRAPTSYGSNTGLLCGTS